VGSPAGAKRSFDAHLSNSETRFEVAFAWFGTSIMQHLEGFNAQMITQSDLPAVGSTVLVESWKIRGYVQRLHTTLQTRWPFLDITFHNYGEGGATSRDILRIVRSNTTPPNPAFAVSILACGINDVWRGFQGRHAEAIDLTEFTDNYRSILEILTATSRQVICIAETPFGWDDTIDVTAANAALRQYNIAAAQIAAAAGSAYIDVWPAFNAAARQLSGNADLSLWSDGVHLSEYGDALLHELVDFRLRTDGTIERMTSYALYDRDRALQLYGSLFEDIRSSKPKQPNVP
jgi:lysophospholipase L1-like esterase